MTCKNNNILKIVVLLSLMRGLMITNFADLRTTTSQYLWGGVAEVVVDDDEQNSNNCTGVQQQRWKQPFQVEIDEYIQSSSRKGYFGAGTITTVNGSSWEYPALSVESLTRSLGNKTVYIDGDSHVYYFTAQLLYFLDYLCPNKSRVGKSTPKSRANIPAILEHEQLYSGVKQNYKSLWGNGQIRFDNCFPLEEKNRTKNHGIGETASYVTVQHSFYYDQVDSGEESILSSTNNAQRSKKKKKKKSANPNNNDADIDDRSRVERTRAKPTTDIAILNFAVMHRMHLFPIKDRWNTEKMIRNLGPSIRFEEQIERTVNSVADAGAKCIFLKTPNPMCSLKDPNMERNFVREFYGNLVELDRGVFDEDSCRARMGARRSEMPDSYNSSFGELSRLDMCNATRLQSKGSELINACVETLHKQLLREGKDMEYGDAHSLCSYRFAQTNVGEESRRDQFQHFVSMNQERYWRERNVKLIYFDFYQIVKDHDNYCQYADDANHYGKLLPLQVKLITNIIGQHCS